MLTPNGVDLTRYWHHQLVNYLVHLLVPANEVTYWSAASIQSGLVNTSVGASTIHDFTKGQSWTNMLFTFLIDIDNHTRDNWVQSIQTVGLSLVVDQQQEHILLFFSMFYAYVLSCKLKCSAYLHVLLEDWSVESVCERHCCIILNFAFLLNANHMFGSSLQEDFADELRMASQHNYKFKVALGLIDDLFESFSAYKLSVAIWSF